MSTDRYAANCDGIPVANFLVYTDPEADLFGYGEFKYTITADQLAEFANTPIKIFVEYLDGTFDIIYGTLDN